MKLIRKNSIKILSIDRSYDFAVGKDGLIFVIGVEVERKKTGKPTV
jgi:hypothetical protein